MKETGDKFRKYDSDLLDYVDALFADSLDEHIFKKYTHYLQTESDVSPRTLDLYVKDLFGSYDPKAGFIRSADFTFLSFLPMQNIRNRKQINRDIIRRYIAWLVENGIAPSSVNRRLSALRSFYKFLLLENKVEHSPIPVGTHQRNTPRSNLSMKMDKRIPVFLTQPEMKQLLEPPDTSKPEGKRDRAMLEILYASGLRVSELCQLDLDSFNLDSRDLRVIGKGNKERMVLMGFPAVSALKDYLDNGRTKLISSRSEKALFLNNHGRRLTVRWVQKMIQQYARSIGLEKSIHPHVLRHTFATHMLDGGADLRVVQELLGHADLSSTQIYTHVTKQQARKVYLTAHPMAQEKDDANG